MYVRVNNVSVCKQLPNCHASRQGPADEPISSQVRWRLAAVRQAAGPETTHPNCISHTDLPSRKYGEVCEQNTCADDRRSFALIVQALHPRDRGECRKELGLDNDLCQIKINQGSAGACNDNDDTCWNGNVLYDRIDAQKCSRSAPNEPCSGQQINHNNDELE